MDRLLCVLRVRGGHLWADGPDGARVFLDGETTANPRVRAGLDLPSGDGFPGGSFALSFWLVAADVSLPLVLSASVNLNVVSGTVSRGGEGVEAATVRLRRTNPPGAGSEQRTRSDAEGQFSFTAVEGEYTVFAESLGDTAEQNVEVGPVIVTPPTPPVGPDDLTVGEIDGIGPVFTGQLTASGVRLVREFVALPPERIAEILSISVDTSAKSSRECPAIARGVVDVLPPLHSFISIPPVVVLVAAAIAGNQVAQGAAGRKGR